jgi:lipopolysaccharide transport system permease protein
MIRPFRAASPRKWIFLRDLLVELVSREIKLRYSQSVLGYAWSLLNPLLQLLVLSLVFQYILPLNVPNYLPFLFTGLIVWNWFQASLYTACGSLVDNRELVRRPSFPVQILPMVTAITNFIHFLLSLPVLFLLLLLYRIPITPALLALPVLFLLQFIIIISLSYFLATFYVTFRDTQYLLGVALMLGFYLTPVFYPSVAVGAKFQFIYHLNPMVVLIDAYRQVLLLGQLPDALALLLVGITFSALLLAGYHLFQHARYHLTEEL